MTMLWSIHKEDVVAGLRARGLSADLTRRELDLVCQHTDAALNEAVQELLDALAARIRRERGREK